MRDAKPRSLLYESRFRSYWIGQTISQFGDRVTELALPLIAVTMLAASPGEVGLLTAAVWLPSLVSLFVGSWVDHQHHKRRILVIADLLRAAILLTLPVAYAFDAVTLPQLFAVALLTGLGSVFYNTAYSPVFVNLVPRESFMEANSLFSSTRSVSYIAGPAVGGALIQILTAPLAVLVDAALVHRLCGPHRPDRADRGEAAGRRGGDAVASFPRRDEVPCPAPVPPREPRVLRHGQLLRDGRVGAARALRQPQPRSVGRPDRRGVRRRRDRWARRRAAGSLGWRTSSASA